MKPWWTEILLSVEQEADCCERGSQVLNLKTQNGGIDFDDTFYVIETERWAFDDFNQLREQIDALERRIKLARNILEEPF